MQSIRLRVDNIHYNVTTKIFSGGEVHVDISYLPHKCNDYNIFARLQSGDDIMQLMMVSDAMARRYPMSKGSITIPYMPYARQDRMCAEGQHFGAAVISQVLNCLYQRHIITYDLHSNVILDELRKNFKISHVEQKTIIGSNIEICNHIKDCHIVAPDKGAVYKAREIHDMVGSNKPMIIFDKKRDPITGIISGLSCEEDEIIGDCFIIDDICDGGGTFIGVAKELKKRGASSISLYTTHGIFSKGFDIFSGVIDNLYTTNSFRRNDGLNSGYVANGVKLTTILV